MADEADSKSVVGNYVRVQVPLPALYIIIRNETAAKVDSQIAFATVFLCTEIKADNSFCNFITINHHIFTRISKCKEMPGIHIDNYRKNI